MCSHIAIATMQGGSIIMHNYNNPPWLGILHTSYSLLEVYSSEAMCWNFACTNTVIVNTYCYFTDTMYINTIQERMAIFVTNF